MRQRIEKGDTAQVFTLADTHHSATLAAAASNWQTPTLLVRDKLCAMAHPALKASGSQWAPALRRLVIFNPYSSGNRMSLLRKKLCRVAVSFLALVVVSAIAQPVQVSNAWMRPTVHGQQASGAYMSLTSPTARTLVGISTPAAGIAEVHEMKMNGDVMKMREIPTLALPAGKTVDLEPGALHVMLMDLKQIVVKGTRVPMTLRFKDAKGVESSVEVNVPVSMMAPAGMAKK